MNFFELYLTRQGLLISLILATMAFAIAGCRQKGGDDAAAGQAVFTANNCARCHQINGQGSARGMDLSHVGGKRNAEWIVAHVKNPQQHTPMSRMPKFEGKIGEADLAALGQYLAGLK